MEDQQTLLALNLIKLIMKHTVIALSLITAVTAAYAAGSPKDMLEAVNAHPSSDGCGLDMMLFREV